MKQLFVRALQLLLIFGILGIPCLLSVTGGLQAEIGQIPYKGADGILNGNQNVGTDELLQFVSGGHVLGFRADDVTIASGDHALRIEFVGSQSISPEDEGATQNSDQSQNGPRPLDRVIYKDLWQGVSLVYEKHNSGVVKSTYLVHPSGSDNTSPVEHIRLRYNVSVSVAENGNLLIPFESGQMTESSPIAWQEINGNQIPVDVSFRAISKQEVGFTVGSYDPKFPLVIDPVLSWMTFLGGTLNDSCHAVAVDGSGNVYVAGISYVSWGTPINPFTSPWDVFVAKLDSTGALLWHTFMGGAGFDYGWGIAVDGSGNIYVAGMSSSTWGTPIVPHSGSSEAFAAKLDNSGNLLWNTFMGGTDIDQGYGLAIDESGNVYIVGRSYATWGTPVNAHAGGIRDAFVVKLNTSGTLLWNTFLGGADVDDGYGVAVDQSGNVYVSGQSYATWGTPVNAFAEQRDAFAAKLDNTGNLLWNTFLGSTNVDMSWGAAVDESGNVYVTGYSNAPWGTPINPHSGAGGADAFAAKLDSSGTLLWNTFMGGTPMEDQGRAIAVDGAGYVYVTGWSKASWGAPIYSHFGDGSHDTLAVKLDSSGIRKQHAFIGGAGDDYGYSIAVDGSGDVYVCGISVSTWGSPINAHAGGTDAFVIKFSLSNPEPDIKANGSDSTITIAHGDPLSVTIELDPGEQDGENADWWILMQTSDSPPNNWYYFDYPSRSWMLGRSPTRQSGLFAVSSKKVPGTSGLAVGTYTFYFAVDMIMNGTINVSAAFYDKIKVIINP